MESTDPIAPLALAETASWHATSAVPRVALDASVGEVVRQLRSRRYESVRDVVVCDEGRLIGVVRIEDLLAAPDPAPIQSIVDFAPPVVAPDTDQEVAARRAVQHGETSLVTVDETGRFVGVVPPARLLGVLLDEHEEDLARLGGYLHSSEEARRAGREPVRRRFVHRLPWLLVGLVGALATALLLHGFEHRLEETVLVAVFVPGIVYLADAVGTQTETVVIRGLSVGVPIREVLGRESLTGVLVGLVLAAAFFPAALLIWGEADVVGAVALAILAACSIATVVALVLPATLHRFGVDPAFGSGPLATVVQDLLSLAIYLGIVVLMV